MPGRTDSSDRQWLTPTRSSGSPRRGRSGGNGQKVWVAIIAVVVVLALSWGASRWLSSKDSDQVAATVTGKGPKVTAAPATGATVKGATGIGAIADEKALSFTVSRLRTGQLGVPGAAADLRPKGQYVLVYIAVRNSGSSAGTFRDSLQVLYDGLGTAYRPDPDATAAASRGSGKGAALPAGRTIDRVLIYDLPKSATPTRIEFHGAKGTAGVVVAL